MEISEIITIGAAGLALLLGGLAYYRSGRPLTLQGVTSTLEAAQPLAEQIRDVAEVAVNAAQQLKETGKIETGDQAFEEAFSHLREWFPDVDPRLLVPFIEAAYRGVKLANQTLRANNPGAGGPATGTGPSLLDRWQREQGAGDPDTPARV